MMTPSQTPTSPCSHFCTYLTSEIPPPVKLNSWPLFHTCTRTADWPETMNDHRTLKWDLRNMLHFLNQWNLQFSETAVWPFLFSQTDFTFCKSSVISFSDSVAFQRRWWTDLHTLFPAPPTLSTSSGFIAVMQSVTNWLLWDRVVVMMCLPAGTSFSWNPKAPKPKTPQIVLPSTASGPACVNRWNNSKACHHAEKKVHYKYSI